MIDSERITSFLQATQVHSDDSKKVIKTLKELGEGERSLTAEETLSYFGDLSEYLAVSTRVMTELVELVCLMNDDLERKSLLG